MTTIAYDGRYLAADGRRTRNHLIMDDDREKLKDVNGTVCAATGSTCDIRQHIDLVSKGVDPDLENLDTDCVYVDGDDVMLSAYSVGEQQISVIEKPCAFGSGDGAAYAALDLGKNAMEAIAITAKRDLYTGGTIRYYDMQQPEHGVRVWKGGETVDTD